MRDAQTDRLKEHQADLLVGGSGGKLKAESSLTPEAHMPPSRLATAYQIPSAELDDWGSVTVPLGEPVSHLRGHILAENPDGSEAGIWECTPGTWQRTVMDAEFCTIISGSATFTPEGGEPISIGPGDIVYFPANSQGVWEVHQTIRKSYLTYK